MMSSQASSLHKQAYLLLVKKRLMLIARSAYDNTYGGKKAVVEYKLTCRLIQRAKTLGEVLRVARDMQLDFPEAVKLILYPFVEGVEGEDLVGAPETW